RARMGLGFGFVEAPVLYAVIRRLKPKRVLEVGGGITTAIIARALQKNAVPCEHVVLEPFPSATLRSMKGIELLPISAQTAGLVHYTRLEAGDFLFIDSSHSVSPG